VSDRLVQDIQGRGNLGYSIGRLFKLRGRSRSPLAIASFIAIPLFFSSLMASTLAQEKPRLVQWTSNGKLQTTYHDPTSGTEARIWLWALLPAALLIVVGYVATRLPYGFYIACLAAIVDAMAVVNKTAVWERHHTHRFPNGVDLIPAANAASDKFSPGQWEQMARATALSLQHWTIVLALISIAVVVGLALKRRYFGRKPALSYGSDEGVHAPSSTKPGLGDLH
jgi:ABC-type branched-subunit amino acid transport system permease subunit